ncbi:hypothetical protein AB0B40_30575 [Streptomyces sp. NPDC042638]|uniref:hypothetical protein n=1 Tax=Streptomyces sp. NPDC042638 TaxID=3154333 RepID=UPI0033CE2700
MESLTFDSDDLDVTEDFLSRAYARMRIASGTPGSTRASIRRTGVPSVSVDELALDFEMDYSVTPLGRVCLCVVHEGTVRDHGFQGVEDSFGPGDVVLFAPPDLPYAERICNARYNITMLDPALLSQVATGPGGSRPVRLTGHPAAVRGGGAAPEADDHPSARHGAQRSGDRGPAADSRHGLPAPGGERTGRVPQHGAGRARRRRS